MFKRLLLALVFGTMFSSSTVPASASAKLPIVYHDEYNISFWGIEKMLHAFDGAKYGKVHSYLMSTFGLGPDSFHAPTGEVSRENLLKVHSAPYLDSLNKSATVAQIAEVAPLKWMPNSTLQSHMLSPMRLATQGTIDACKLALTGGWAINLAGGYHHAKRGNGEGFCVYADIPLACKIILEAHPNFHILIVDLDAHQGNGVSMIRGNDLELLKHMTIMDVYNPTVYPRDWAAQDHVTYKYGVRPNLSDADYLGLLKTELPKAIDEVHPDLIIYNAGTDILAGDPIGQFDNITADGIIKRDAFVFKTATNKDVPIAMVLSGGYTTESGPLIGKSIANILASIMKIEPVAASASVAKTRHAATK